jgi:hypothetical protein
VEIYYNEDTMSIRLVEGGASEGCRPKLPRWPFSAPAAPLSVAQTGTGYSTGAVPGESSFFVRCHVFFTPPATSIFAVVLPAMQTPAGTWITTTSLIDLWIVAASEALI